MVMMMIDDVMVIPLDENDCNEVEESIVIGSVTDASSAFKYDITYDKASDVPNGGNKFVCDKLIFLLY